MSPRPYYETEGVTVYAGDCLAVMPELAAESVDAIVTDPPYHSGAFCEVIYDRPQ